MPALSSDTPPDNPASDYTLGERICRARDAMNLTTAQLARRVGIKTVTLQGWESDRAEPRSNKLVLLAGVLNVSPTWLLVGHGTAPTPSEVTDVETLRSTMDRLHRQALDLAEEIERVKAQLDGLP